MQTMLQQRYPDKRVPNTTDDSITDAGTDYRGILDRKAPGKLRHGSTVHFLLEVKTGNPSGCAYLLA